MVEMEIIKDIKKAENIESAAKSTNPKDASSTKLEQGQSAEECTKHQDISLQTDIDPRNLQPGDVFYGTIKTKGSKSKSVTQQGIFLICSAETKGKNGTSKEFTLKNFAKQIFNVCSGAIKICKPKSEEKKKQIEQKALEMFGSDEKRKENAEKEKQKFEEEKALKKIQYEFATLNPETKLHNLIKAGMNNIWMVGPAGCGKSTIVRNTAKELGMPYLCISCGIGTSATEFTGYKYPTREATKFAEFYAQKSIILIDEMTALDPSVAQVINAALANDEIETTTGTVHRHPECIIVATSNTFGNGADRQYVANNQLDASTIDRFIGAIIEVNYSEEYESQYDAEIVGYVRGLRNVIKINTLRRIASTRMIQAGQKMKKAGISDWKDLLIVNWSDTEKKIVKSYFHKKDTSYIDSFLNAAQYGT